MLRSIKSTQRLVRELLFRIDGVGDSILEGSTDATYLDNGVGSYTITFNIPFKRVPVVNVTTLTAGSYAEIGAVSASAVTILTKVPSSGAAVDAAFHMSVKGFDAPDFT